MRNHGALEFPARDAPRTQYEPAPRVSILMPNYNGEKYLEAAVSSALAQQYPNFELIIVDDGSTDRSPEILARIAAERPTHVRLLRHDGHANRGLIETYSLALSQAEGEIVAFHESDDLWHAENLRRKVEVLRQHPEVGVVHGDFQPFGDFRGSLYWALYGWTNRWLLPGRRPYGALGALLLRNPVPSFTHFVVRRSLLDGLPRLGVLARNFDWWVLAHLSARTRFYFIPEKLTSWRVHRTSSHYGPAKVPFGTLRQYLLALYESLLALDEIRQHAGNSNLVRNARDKLSRFEIAVSAGPNRVIPMVLRNPLISLSFLIDSAMRRLLFT